MAYKVIFTPEARQDLNRLYDYIAEMSYRSRAVDYVKRIEIFCFSLSTFPVRGKKQDNIQPNLRSISFEKRVMIAFHIEGKTVIIDRILYGGRNLKKAFDDNE